MLNKQIIVFIAALFFSHFSLAANWYRVELVVFEQLSPYSGGEIFGVEEDYPILDGSVDLMAGPAAGFESVRRSTLSGVFYALKVSRQYRPLMHMAWKQPGRNGPNAPSVHVFAGDGGMNKIDGAVRIRSGKYLYIDVDMAYFFDNMNQTNVDADVAKQFTRMLETRKVKLNEMHYFDHPLFGAVMRISRL